MNFQIKELIIPVPWGHIAAKAWGNEKDEIVLVFHGKFDNAGSFDRLIPLLPHSFYYICFDLPNHGKSSAFHPFFPIYTLDYLVVYKIIVDYFKHHSYIFLGHSYGTIISQIFARLYPQHVKKLIMLDCIIVEPIEPNNEIELLLQGIDGVIKLHEKSISGKRPEFTYADALKRTQENRESGRLTEDEAALILDRSLEPAGDGKYRFTTDGRMKMYLDPLQDIRYILESLKSNPVTCPALYILAKNTMPVVRKSYPCIDVIKKWKNASIQFVDGTHDVHLKDPERISPLISEFLIKQYSKI